MRHLALIILILCWPLSAVAFGPGETYPDIETETPLTTAQLEASFKGQTHTGSYNFLHKNITTFAFEETTFADGRIRHVQQGHVDTGEWSISNNLICYDYDDPGLSKACFEIYVRGNCYYHSPINSSRGLYRRFTARSVIAGQTADCEPNLV